MSEAQLWKLTSFDSCWKGIDFQRWPYQDLYAVNVIGVCSKVSGLSMKCPPSILKNLWLEDFVRSNLSCSCLVSLNLDYQGAEMCMPFLMNTKMRIGCFINKIEYICRDQTLLKSVRYNVRLKEHILCAYFQFNFCRSHRPQAYVSRTRSILFLPSHMLV